MICRLLALLAILTVTLPVAATDYTNSTGTYLDVNALVQTATVAGDRVFVVGPVSNTWSSILSMPYSGVQLIATNGVVVTRTNSGKIINLGTSDYVRVSGFTFYHYGTSSSDSIIYTKGQGVFVDHCNLWSGNNIKKIGLYPDGVNTSDSPNGCAYACYFDRTRMLDHVGGICHQPPGCLPAALEWAAPDRRGTTNQWVLENCTFRQVQSTLHNSTDDEYGGTYTVRFSTFTNTTAEAHSNGSGVLPQERANRSVEIYGNTFIQQAPVNLGSPAMFVRGGTGGAWSNTITGTWPSTTKVIKFDAERGFSGAGQGQSPVDGNNPIDDHGTGTHTGANGASVLTDATASWPVGSLVNGTGVHAFWLYNLTQGTHFIVTANTATTVTSSNVWNTGDSYKLTGGYPLRDQLGTFQDVSPWLLTNSPPLQTLSPFCYTANIINGNPAGIFIDPASTFWIVDGVAITNRGPTWTLLIYPHPLVTYYGIFTNVPPPVAAKLAFIQQPTDVVATSPITPSITVQVQDASGNPVTSSTASITLAIGTNPGSGTLSGTTTHSAVAGLATFSGLSINNSGTGYTLTAASGTLTGTNSTSFNVAPLPPPTAAKLAFIQQPTDTVAGTSITPSITVQVQDSMGNIVTNGSATITLSIVVNPGGGTLSGTLTTPSTNGIATFPGLSIDKTGNGYTLLAASGALTGSTSTPFNITVGAASKLAFSQQPSTTLAGASITPAMTVQIQDALGNQTTSTANVTLAIGVNPSGGVLSGTLTTPAVSGLATFSSLSIDKAGVGYTLMASSGGLTGTNSLTFNITSPPPPATNGPPIDIGGGVRLRGGVNLHTGP